MPAAVVSGLCAMSVWARHLAEWRRKGRYCTRACGGVGERDCDGGTQPATHGAEVPTWTRPSCLSRCLKLSSLVLILVLVSILPAPHCPQLSPICTVCSNGKVRAGPQWRPLVAHCLCPLALWGWMRLVSRLAPIEVGLAAGACVVRETRPTADWRRRSSHKDSFRLVCEKQQTRWLSSLSLGLLYLYTGLYNACPRAEDDCTVRIQLGLAGRAQRAARLRQNTAWHSAQQQRRLNPCPDRQQDG